ncbi:MAG: alpha/beta hydrolase [Actinomycetota bacterium]|nr:alpha/beta hydrolase [Actinomycetota bacterium]
MAPERVERLVLISEHVLPYDDPDVIAALSEAERDDVASLLRGRTAELEQQYAASAAHDPTAPLRQLAEGWSPQERSLATTPWFPEVAESAAFGLRAGRVGFLEDGLRSVRPLEIDLADVRCPVRLIHGEADDLEPYANVERLVPRLVDATLLALPGMGHLGPWLWPDVIMGILTGY